MEDKNQPDPEELDRAKIFWAEKKDVDELFNDVFGYLEHLKTVLKSSTATEKEYLQALRLLEILDCSPSSCLQDQDSSVVQVVIGSGELLPADLPDPSPPFAPPEESSSCGRPPAGIEELLPPLVPVQLQYQPHQCCKACLPSLPRMPQPTLPFWGQNPLKVPLLCGFKRLMSQPGRGGSPSGEEEEEEEEEAACDVVYKAPCGQSLRSFEDVMLFLVATESYDLLQVDFFTFNPSVELDPPSVSDAQILIKDLSRGLEPTPVELCAPNVGSRPPEFRYRKDRWPHGCFLSQGPTLFSACCDCTDGCSDARSCACVAMTTRGRGYSYRRLLQPVESGLFECGPWCDCDRARCQNRLVQRGIRARLQVFQTEDRGWGVRCRDDLDRGTFVCIYAGVVLQKVLSPDELPPPKLTRADLPSDDEVEVVTEWRAPPVLEERRNLVDTPPPCPNVPVIQTPAEASAPPLDQQVQTVVVGGPDLLSSSTGDRTQQMKIRVTTGGQAENRTKREHQRGVKRAAIMEGVCFVDASKEGNVSRFINHSCQPNLFIQNVFIDSHDPVFPVVAFFTRRAVKAGTELTWNYAAYTPGLPQQKQEVPCLCRSDKCQQWLLIDDDVSCLLYNNENTGMKTL
ncbi:histone-lysine N-methyltransferase SETDB2 isoform X1 [Oryzias latipes]|uniref:Histone-lysine N-methyltransferase SETDB2 n=1 Tax=Oryzias latipes TaxID=8090 RepID=H2L6G4_ORYLA|nr:histone-lysine N-methyltransferase SETDB2 isoform X1 [Oryzias latipes]XP_011481060.1 histone-lysine N-methyltransferase SETDB2 isoform X1 [Oryzias latipes]XP_011481073.1 histone-lysine N-methyltransferase SETDB2 isoform X1 [Oryzias latipes]XP_011481082.1 histone-lysine N-methyltransferase SETDB2 isoform X1 [Oryzias latipes]XP_011481086.1 histone-lysine N-methyltransferase SETDB2 isoform X1 [Oryzias latipes]XP_011481089.1 histone-lysine N-methyltransferase SETDB2 isoform X1 [Oryzias latipes]